MKIRKFEKNSEEWLEYRKGKSGGSAFGKLYKTGLPLKGDIIKKLEEENPLPPADKRLPVARLAEMLTPEERATIKLQEGPRDEYYKLIAERVARPMTPNDYVDRLGGEPFSAMARGHLLEPEAIEAFNAKTGKKADPACVVWEREDNPNIYISPDATIGLKEAVEVKCLDSWRVVKAYLTQEIPEDYSGQILKYFIVNDKLETLYFVFYTDLIPGLELQVFEIKREDIADKIPEAKAYEEQIMRNAELDTQKILSLSF